MMNRTAFIFFLKISFAAILATLAIPTCFGAKIKPALYAAADNDFQTLLEGMSAAMDVQPEFFPHEIKDIDVVLYDASKVYVFSHKGQYGLEGRGHLQDYFIYQATHSGKISELEMGRCGAPPKSVSEALYNRIPQNYLACAPWTTFAIMQARHGGFDPSRESYLAAVIHEFARHYMSQELWQIPIVMDMIARVQSIRSKQSKEEILRETYAYWCELAASEKLYPEHARRLRHDFYAPGLDDSRNWGIKIALDMMPKEDKQQ